jgi:hypothetical protein
VKRGKKKQEERNAAIFFQFIPWKQNLLGGYSGKHIFMWFLNIYYLSFPGGFLHGLNDLTYGVDMTQIRWMGILQVLFFTFLIISYII